MNTQPTISKCIDGIISKMQAMNYSESTVKHYQCWYGRFNTYCKNHGYEYYSEGIGLSYLEEYFGIKITSLAERDFYSRKLRDAIRFQLLLSCYNSTQSFNQRFFKGHPVLPQCKYWNEVYESYTAYLRKQDYKKSTFSHKELTVRSALTILIDMDIPNFSRVDNEAINHIIEGFIHYQPSVIKSRIQDLNQFFTFCFAHGYSSDNKSELIPAIKMPHIYRIPVHWDTDTVKKLLLSVDRANPKGKRDYAILLLAARLGIRAIDIAELKLTDLNWATNEIALAQQKTNQVVHLPLLNDVGWALIDYIQNGRPQVEDKFIFRCMNAPYGQLKGSQAIESIFHSRLNMAGIKLPDQHQAFGIHSLRHTLGRILLEKETPLPVISQIMGHQDIRSTDTYIHIDMKGLAQCTLDPAEVLNYAL